MICPYEVSLNPPSLDDPKADADGLLAALAEQHGVTRVDVDLESLREISSILRSQDWKVQVCLRGRELIAIGPRFSSTLGLAVDLGTTKIAGYLVDLPTGAILASGGIVNPQIAMGEDIIARMARAKDSPSEAARLQELVVSALNRLTTDLCKKIGSDPQEVVEAVVASNTAIHHLLLRLPVEQLALSPYVPVVKNALDVKAREIGLSLASGAYIHLLPNIGGFIGGDLVAFLLATGFHKKKGVALALDIGTNTEVCLSVDGKLASLSCASGPAFEGAHIRYGMRSCHGAIEHLRLEDGGVRYQTIGGNPPVGICGTGLLEAVAQLLLIGILDRKGRMGEHPRVRLRDREQEFVITDGDNPSDLSEITITQRDIQQMQLAKGAIRAGIRVLLEISGRTEEDITEVIIAGAFGSYLDIGSAITVGMLPRIPLDRYRQVGNAAGAGARLALISRRQRAEAQVIAQQVTYVEPTTTPRFMQIFAQSMYLE